MNCSLRIIGAAGGLLVALSAAEPTLAQKQGGILRLQHFDSPASMSILEEATRAAEEPAMAVMNNLVIYDQHVAQNSLSSIVPDLATKWEWSEDGKELTFPLRQGVKWHDGKPFTATDVKCTWDLLMGIGSEKPRVNPRKTWYVNLDQVTTNGDYEVTFHLKRPQPAMLSLLASGWSPVYPCHVPPRDMRSRPIGTGPFKFVEFKPNESVKVARNPDYWKPGRPYLDAIEYTLMPNPATSRLAFSDILGDGQGDIGGAMMPPPAGSWGMPPEVLQTLPGYGSDVAKNRAEAREIMKKLGYGPDKRLAVTVTTRNTPAYRDPSVLLIDQLKEIYIDGTLNAIDTTQWYPTVMRKDYAVGLTVSENGLDDPDQQFYENFVCGAERNYSGYCSPEVDALVDRQSMEADPEKRKKIVWEIERKLAADVARPIIFYP